jgi:hypothetical protein
MMSFFWNCFFPCFALVANVPSLEELSMDSLVTIQFYDRLHADLDVGPSHGVGVSKSRIFKQNQTPLLSSTKTVPLYYCHSSGKLIKEIPPTKPLAFEKTADREYTLQLHGENKILFFYNEDEKEKDPKKSSEEKKKTKKDPFSNDPNKLRNVGFKAKFSWGD